MMTPPLRQRTDLGAVMGRVIDQHGEALGLALILASLCRDTAKLATLMRVLDGRRRPQAAA